MGRHESYIPDLYDVRSPSIELALQLVKTLASNTDTPHDAAILTLLFSQLQETDKLALLGARLCSEAKIFIGESPRDQPNQASKVLIAACCIYCREFTDEGRSLSKKHFEEYIDYAANQGWLDDPFLAFYCHHLSDVIAVRQTTIDFFQKNYARYVERKNVAAVAQSLLVLGDTLNDVEKGRCYQVIQDNSQAHSVPDLAWSLLALSTSSDSNIQRISHEMGQELMEHLNERTAAFAHILGILDFLVLGGHEISQSDIKELEESLQISIDLQVQNAAFVLRLPINENTPALSTFLLVLFSIVKSGWINFTGVYEAQRDDLISTLDEAQQSQGKVAVTQFELAIANVLTILSTLLIGVVLFSFFIGAEMSPPRISFSRSDWRNVDVWLAVGGALSVVLIYQLRAAVTGKSAISYWLELTPFKQLRDLRNDFIIKRGNRA